MKHLFKISSLIFALVFIFSSCDKVDKVSSYTSGNSATLSASSTTIAATAADSSNKVISFSWTDPNHATDSSTYKYVLQFDSAGRNFTKAFSKTVTGVFSDSLTGKEFNDILLGLGFNYNVTYSGSKTYLFLCK